MKRIIVTPMIAVGLAAPAAASALAPAPAREPVTRDLVAAGAAAATRCSNETVAIHGKQTALRVIVRGASCSKARSLIRTYFHDIATKGCKEHGTACIFVYRGVICAYVSKGWTCSLPLYPGESGGDFGGCARQMPPATVRVFARKPIPGT